MVGELLYHIHIFILMRVVVEDVGLVCNDRISNEQDDKIVREVYKIQEILLNRLQVRYGRQLLVTENHDCHENRVLLREIL